MPMADPLAMSPSIVDVGGVGVADDHAVKVDPFLGEELCCRARAALRAVCVEIGTPVWRCACATARRPARLPA